MKLPQLSVREQILTAIVLTVVILGIYVALRFIPANKAIMSTYADIESTEKRLLKARIPEEPLEDLNSLVSDLQDQEQAMALVRSEAEAIEQKLAAFDSQELKVRISQLAREAKLNIRINERMQGVNTTQSATKQKKKSKPAANEPVVLPETMSWIARMSPETAFHRPMQRLEIEGDFQSLQQFIYGLDSLPWQVTVLRMNISKLPVASPYGYAQRLHTELVLAL